MPAIKDREVLISLIQKMYWVESEMEQMNTWEARIEMMDENLEALEVLSHDSDRHGSIVEKWLKKANLEVPETTPKGLPKHIFNFDGLSAPEIFNQIVKYEILAMNAYKDMKNADPDVINVLFENENDRKEFLEDLEQLIKDEEKHTSICKKQIGGFMKVNF
ncbi:hypothetical protein V7O62_12815 [Methanolobus sp. ZRKC2]|uniref:hypothetical protein n=1 Tax=Methanolobus sp. ZRKC2 TaxID=3125783 RepID=UPI00324E9EB0